MSACPGVREPPTAGIAPDDKSSDELLSVQQAVLCRFGVVGDVEPGVQVKCLDTGTFVGISERRDGTQQATAKRRVPPVDKSQSASLEILDPFPHGSFDSPESPRRVPLQDMIAQELPGAV